MTIIKLKSSLRHHTATSEKNQLIAVSDNSIRHRQKSHSLYIVLNAQGHLCHQSPFSRVTRWKECYLLDVVVHTTYLFWLGMVGVSNWNDFLFGKMLLQLQMILTLLSLISGTHYKETKAYSQQTLALSILLTALLALVLGFTVGLLVSRRCQQQKQLHLTEIYDKTLNFTKWVCVTIKSTVQETYYLSLEFTPFEGIAFFCVRT